MEIAPDNSCLLGIDVTSEPAKWPGGNRIVAFIKHFKYRVIKIHINNVK